jgi:excisionase family DNA binding protein
MSATEAAAPAVTSERMSAPEAARRLGVTDSYVRKLLASGQLAGKKKNGAWRISVAEVERYRERNGPPEERDSAGEERNLERDRAEVAVAEAALLKERIEAMERDAGHLRQQAMHLQEQNDRLTILLGNEQASRMQALPRRRGWFSRLFVGEASAG